MPAERSPVHCAPIAADLLVGIAQSRESAAGAVAMLEGRSPPRHGPTGAATGGIAGTGRSLGHRRAGPSPRTFGSGQNAVLAASAISPTE